MSVSAYVFVAICTGITRNVASSTILTMGRNLNLRDVFGNDRKHCFEGEVLIPGLPVPAWNATISFKYSVYNFQVYNATILERTKNDKAFVVGNAASNGYLEAGDDFYLRFQGFSDGIIPPNATITLKKNSHLTILHDRKPPARNENKLQIRMKRSTRRCRDDRQNAAIVIQQTSHPNGEAAPSFQNDENVNHILKRSLPGVSPFLPVVSLEKNVEEGEKGLKDDLGLFAANDSMITWTSKWGVGGSGQIDLQKDTHGFSGRSWIFRLLFPRGCYLSTAKFWHACIVDSLTEPENGLFTFKQVGWQIYQDFIGILVTFQQISGLVDCYKSENYHVRYEDTTTVMGMFPETCTEEFVGIELPESVSPPGVVIIGSERTKENVRPVTVRTTTEPLAEISPVAVTTTPSPITAAAELATTITTTTKTTTTLGLQQVWLASTEPPVNEERVARLRASIVSPTSVRLSWRRVQPRQRRISISYTMSEEPEDRVARDSEVSIRKQSTSRKASLWPTVTKEISARMTTLVIRDLQPGRTYDFTAKVWDGSAYGPETSVSTTLAPSQIGEIRVTNPNSTALRFQWIKPRGFQRSIIICYYPPAVNGFPKSPFTLPGTATKATISGLDKRQEYAVSFAVNNKDTTGDAKNVTAKTGNNLCGRRGCQRFAKCVQRNLTSECLCNLGYAEDSVLQRNGQNSPQRKICRDIDECSGDNDCNENASCKNAPGSYRCQCTTGYEGDGKYCFDVDECGFTEIDVCPGAACRNTDGSYTCQCEEGYVYIEASCQDVDECASENTQCPENAECLNTEGSYLCECPKGRRFIENECQDIDECSENNHDCGKSQRCVNTRGGFACLCPKGTRKTNRTTCRDINECNEGLDNCNEFATCKNANPSFSCSCKPGYVGNGVLCKDINECRQRHDCDRVGGECTNTIGSYKCACKQGYSGNGRECFPL